MKLSEKMDTHKSYQLFINIISYFFLANQYTLQIASWLALFFRPLWLWKFIFYFFLANQLNPQDSRKYMLSQLLRMKFRLSMATKEIKNSLWVT